MKSVWVCSDCYSGPTLFLRTLEPQKCVICGEMKKNVSATYPKWVKGDNCPRCRIPLEVQTHDNFKKWWACTNCQYRRRMPEEKKEE